MCKLLCHERTNQQTNGQIEFTYIMYMWGLLRLTPNSALNYVMNFGMLTILLLQLIGTLMHGTNTSLNLLF